MALLNGDLETLVNAMAAFTLMFYLLWVVHPLAAPGHMASRAGELNTQTLKGSSVVSEEGPSTWSSQEAHMVTQHSILLGKCATFGPR